MEKNTPPQEQKNPKGLKNSRYWENLIPETGEKQEEHVPDALNPKRIQELH